MAKYNYPKYKILLDPHSKKTQGLRVGDVVRRQYYDAPNLIYSLMVVIETGIDVIGRADSAYFIGALIEGNEPKAGELLDFARITNLFDEDRSGALYMTASDSDNPFLDVIDGAAVEKSLCYPTMGGGVPTIPDKNKYAFFGTSVTELYKPSEGEATRVYRITTKASGNFGLQVSIEEPVANPQRILISFKVRSSRPQIDAQVRFGYTNNQNMDFVDRITVSTDWEYKFLVFNADYPAQYRRSFFIDLNGTQLPVGQWIEIADLNIIRQSDISDYSKSSKTRVGKVKGVIDPVFGTLEGYGAYFQNLYATKNVNIAGTLTAGDENGFASTFYVGKIHKNVILNSINPVFVGVKPTLANEKPPAGIGRVWRLTTTVGMNAQTSQWRSLHLDKPYCFSVWLKAQKETKIQFIQDNYIFKEFTIEPSDEWRRYHAVVFIKSSTNPNLYLYISTNVSGVMFSSPQLEAGTKPSQYQATDGKLSEVEDYGAWFNKGGIGGTIQNPLLKLNEDGSISSRDDSFVIKQDGTGHFASGRFKWTKNTITLQDVTIKWEDLDEDTKEELLPKSVNLAGTSVFHYPDTLGHTKCEPEEIYVFATETNFNATFRKWHYLTAESEWSEIHNGQKDFLTIYPDGHYWEEKNVLTVKYTAFHKDESEPYEDIFTLFKQYDGSDAYSVYIESSNGLTFRNGVISTTLTAQVKKGVEDVTHLIPEENFRWTRTSNDAESDKLWNSADRIGKSIEITAEDVYYKAVFDCEVILSATTRTILNTMIIELRHTKSELFFPASYEYTGSYSNRNAKILTIVDKDDIAHKVTIDLNDTTETDLSSFEGKTALIYIEEAVKDAGIELYLSLKRK